jgi:hypothetical protein
MADGLLVKVQFPPGSLKKTATVKLVADGTVAAAVQEIAKAGHLSRPEQYLIYCAEGTKRKWLIETQTLAEAGITAQSVVHLQRKFQMIKVKVFLSAQQQFTQSVLMNVTEPLSSFVPFAKKKFQLDSSVSHSYGFLVAAGAKHQALNMSSSLTDLDLPPDVELVMVDKEKTVTEAALRVKSPIEERKTASLSGYLMYDKKKRWMILEGPTLTAHKSQEEADPKRPIETVLLSEFCSVLDDKEKKKVTIDLISIKSRKDTHQIKCVSEEEAGQWHIALKTACAPDSALPALSLSSKGSSSASPSPSSPHGTGYYGVPIEKVTPPNAEVPYIVEHAIKVLEEKSMQVEGIFRLSGSSAQIDKLKSEFNSGTLIDLKTVSDPHTVSGVLKLWFRELPEPLMTYDLYESFIAAQQERDPNKRIRYLRHLISNLPPVNRATLKYLIEFLNRVEKHSEVNKMTVTNLATVFAPNLLKQREDNMVQSAMDTPLINGLISNFIKEYEMIFSDEEPAELTPSLAKAMYDHKPENENQLAFSANDIIRVYQQGDVKGWWYGELNGYFGLFPGSFVQLQPVNKKQQFLNDMAAVRAKIAEEKKLIASLEAAKAQLTQEMHTLHEIKETATEDAKSLKVEILRILEVTPELASFNSELEQLYSHLESYHKTRLAMQQSRSNLLDELSTLKRAIATEPKFKKYKDKLTPLIDNLVTKLEEEQIVRKQVDDKKDTVFKDLTELRVLIGHK